MDGDSVMLAAIAFGLLVVCMSYGIAKRLPAEAFREPPEAPVGVSLEDIA